MSPIPLRISTVLLTALLCLGLVAPALAKRGPPKPIKPVTLDGTEFRVDYKQFQKNDSPAGMRAWITAHDPKTGKELWRLQIFEVTYLANLETDVQDVYFTSLAISEGNLLAESEKSTKYRIDIQKRTVQELKEKK